MPTTIASAGGMAVNSVLNYSYLLRAAANNYRDRVFATIETLTWTMMMISMMGADIASTHPQTVEPRAKSIGIAPSSLSPRSMMLS